MMESIYLAQEPSLRQNYRRAVERVGCRCCIGEGKEQCDGLLLTGGGDIAPWRYGASEQDIRDMDAARDALEWALVEEFLSAGKPILGICRGLQVLNVYFGGTLVQNIYGHSAHEGVDTYHTTRIAPSFLRSLYGEALTVNSAHHQAINRLAPNFTAIQWAADGVIEAVCHRSLPIWGVQWHPERLKREGERLFKKFAEKLRERG